MIAVTDTHALLWAMTGQARKLGRKAKACFDRAERGKATIYVPAFTLVEIGELVHRGRIALPADFESWIRALAGSGRFVVHALDVDVVVRTSSLRDIPERSDRIIAASAAVLDCPLMTRDAEVAASAGVVQLWN
jgi:PIN domain nuclease of toxin-antitoxin system